VYKTFDMQLRPYIPRAALWIFLVGLTLEVCARLDDWLSYGAPLLGPYNSERLYTYDELGKKGRPNARYLKWQLNSLGYRGPELEPGRIRVACIGSSETFGLYESEGGEWPRRLENELNRRAGWEAFQVINAAYPGMSVATAARRLPQLIETANPTLFVIYPSFAPYIWLPYLRPEAAPPSIAPWLQLRIIERVKTLAKDLLPEPLQTQWRRLAIWLAVKGGVPVMDRVPEENIQKFQTDLEQLLDRIRQHGGEAVLVTHATRFGQRIGEGDESLLVAWRRFYPMLAEEGFLDMERRMNQALREVARKRGLRLVDAAAKIQPGPETFVEFVHFTDAGAEELARLVAASLDPFIARARTAPPSGAVASSCSRLGN
jgi:lysophospholipase L1-like esterase